MSAAQPSFEELITLEPDEVEQYVESDPASTSPVIFADDNNPTQDEMERAFASPNFIESVQAAPLSRKEQVTFDRIGSKSSGRLSSASKAWRPKIDRRSTIHAEGTLPHGRSPQVTQPVFTVRRSTPTRGGKRGATDGRATVGRTPRRGGKRGSSKGRSFEERSPRRGGRSGASTRQTAGVNRTDRGNKRDYNTSKAKGLFGTNFMPVFEPRMLNRVTPAATSKLVINNLLDQIGGWLSGPDDKIVVAEIGGGLGRDTITLLAHPIVKKVISYEADVIIRSMQMQNVGMAFRSEGISPDTEFESRSAFTSDDVDELIREANFVFMDPMWVDPHDATKTIELGFDDMSIDKLTSNLVKGYTEDEYKYRVEAVAVKVPPYYDGKYAKKTSVIKYTKDFRTNEPVPSISLFTASARGRKFSYKP